MSGGGLEAVGSASGSRMSDDAAAASSGAEVAGGAGAAMLGAATYGCNKRP